MYPFGSRMAKEVERTQAGTGWTSSSASGGDAGDDLKVKPEVVQGSESGAS